MKSSFSFEVLYTSKRSKARVGRITTPHGPIDTPNFVAVGTNGTLKTLDNATVDALGLQLMFCNTYHLLLQPGPKIVQQAGGLHQFIQRKQPIITDSGGFQIFSLMYGSVADEIKSKGTKKQSGTVLKIDEQGVVFRSYRDGQKILLTPESSVEAQKAFGADIIIPLDELPPYHMGETSLKQSLERTHRWEKRSLAVHLKDPAQQAMYAVIHGGTCPSLRQKSCVALRDLGFDGFAIGGSLGKNTHDVIQTVQETTGHLPDEQPRHLLGIGDVETLQQCIPKGIDTFDSSYPTKAARHGVLLSATGPIKIKQSRYCAQFRPIETDCVCPCCQHFSLAYLHHLFKAKEPTALQLASYHNVAFMVRLMQSLRTQILCGLI